ncbi:SURF1-domain-containing protein [Athelia psychrophila]|uniref:SURF1-like protein n=1 Tax=Athelia psychrophila TaxID=1759441 RepID=A0A166NWF2_9AGAM|nr:SURF1-domain-containing protein [Fibularhizoctonia sp. CBS 109695]
MGFMPIFTFALGTWQLKRLQWKVNLIDELREKLEREPINLPHHVNLSVIPDFTFRKVYLKGIWDHAHTMFLGPRVREGAQGYNVVTPLVRADGSTVLVDRGFVLKENLDNGAFKQATGEVELLGMIRTSQNRNTFTPDNQPEQNQWYWTDVQAMADHAGGEAVGVQPVFIEEIFEGYAGEAGVRISRGVPLGREPTVDVRNSHLSYIVTWYSLSAFTAFMMVRLVSKRRRLAVARPMPRH